MAMIKFKVVFLALAGVCLIAGCAMPFKKTAAAPPEVVHSKGAQSLASGIVGYEDGKYVDAAKTLQGALDLGLDLSEQVTAHKYLAFIQCISGKERLCRDEFKKALDLDPNMELAPAEAGHPIWGPVFKSTKGKKPDVKK
jgi:Tfp pilus assembly protein PilF